MKLEERINCKYTGIYKITCKITGHCYIGQAKNINIRIYEHIRSAFDINKTDYDYPLHKAFRKYGLDNFDLEILERCSYSKLNEREEYWVAMFDARKNGYNQTDGGQQSIRFIKLTKTDVKKIKKLLAKDIITDEEIAKQFGVSRDFIYRINSGRAWFDDRRTYPIRNTATSNAYLKLRYHYDGTIIYQIDKQTDKVIGKFASGEVAEKVLNAKRGLSINIGRCCRGLRQTAAGYKWLKVEATEEEWQKVVLDNIKRIEVK